MSVRPHLQGLLEIISIPIFSPQELERSSEVFSDPMAYGLSPGSSEVVRCENLTSGSTDGSVAGPISLLSTKVFQDLVHKWQVVVDLLPPARTIISRIISLSNGSHVFRDRCHFTRLGQLEGASFASFRDGYSGYTETQTNPRKLLDSDSTLLASEALVLRNLGTSGGNSNFSLHQERLAQTISLTSEPPQASVNHVETVSEQLEGSLYLQRWLDSLTFCSRNPPE